jgi:hypothetical protein
MVRSYLAVAGMTVATISLSVMSSNCGGSTTVTSSSAAGGGKSSTSTTTSSSSSSSGSGAEPPAMNPKAPMPDGTTPVTFAIKSLYLGETDPDGGADKTNGWKQYGFDLDGQNDTATTANHCKPSSGAPTTNFINGNNGIDNSFGANILNIIMGILPAPSSKINDSINQGKFTIMLQMENLGAGTSYQGLTTQLFGGEGLPTPPKWDGSDNWPVTPELLKDGMTIAGGSLVQFPMSYVTNNTWVSGSKGNVTLALSVGGLTLNLTIANAQIAMQMDAAHKTATNGIIGGVLNTEALTTQLQIVAGTFDPSLCSGPTVEEILTEIKQASDIGSDGTQDPTKTCDGISIGIGFDASIVANPTTVAPMAVPKPNPCSMDAGTD